MTHHLMNLRHVPDDEAEEIRALFEAHEVRYYETPPSRWGISMGGFWVRIAATGDLDMVEALGDLVALSAAVVASGREDDLLPLWRASAAAIGGESGPGTAGAVRAARAALRDGVPGPIHEIAAGIPAAMQRLPHSRNPMRASWMSLMQLVLVRSRPGSHAFEQAMAAASWPCTAGSPATIASSSAVAASRAAARSA